MKAARRRKRVTAKLRTNFRGANNGHRQTAQEIMRELQESDAAQRCPLEVLSPIRQAYTISAVTVLVDAGAQEWRGHRLFSSARENRAAVYAFVSMADKCIS